MIMEIVDILTVAQVTEQIERISNKDIREALLAKIKKQVNEK